MCDPPRLVVMVAIPTPIALFGRTPSPPNRIRKFTANTRTSWTLKIDPFRPSIRTLFPSPPPLPKSFRPRLAAESLIPGVRLPRLEANPLKSGRRMVEIMTLPLGVTPLLGCLFRQIEARPKLKLCSPPELSMKATLVEWRGVISDGEIAVRRQPGRRTIIGLTTLLAGPKTRTCRIGWLLWPMLLNLILRILDPSLLSSLLHGFVKLIIPSIISLCTERTKGLLDVPSQRYTRPRKAFTRPVLHIVPIKKSLLGVISPPGHIILAYL